VDTDGALDEASDEDRVRDSPDLTVTATDDNDDPNITTSGVVSTKVIFNGDAASPANKSFSQSCTSGCSLTHTFQFNLSSLPEGSNTVDVVTTDGAGNQDDQSWNFVKDSTSPRPSCSDPSADPNNCQPSPPSSSRAACNPSLPLGAVTTARSGDAVDVANQNYPGLLSDSDAVTREGLALKPTLTGSVVGIDPSSRLTSTGTLTLSEIMSLQIPSYTVGSGLSGVCVRDDSVVATDRRVTGNSVAYGTTASSVDTILRPSVFGMMEFQQIRDANAPTIFASTIDLTPGQYLKQLEDGSIAIIDPSLPTISSAQPRYDAAATPDEVGSSDTDPVAPSPQTDAGPPALASTDLAGLAPVLSDLDPADAGHYEDERELLDSADQKTDGQAIAVIAAPSAQDSSGTRVPASQTITATTPTSAVITTTYDHKSALYSYPVYGQRSTTSSGNKRGHHAVTQGLASGEQNGLIAHNSQNEGAPKALAGLNGQMLKYVMPRYDACEPYQSLSDLRNAPAGTPCRAAAKWVQQALNIQSKQPSKHIKLFVSAWWGPVGGALDPATAPSRGSGRVAVAFQHIWNKAPFNKVDFWSPMNEPNLAVQQDGGDPAGGLAAHVFKRTRSASRSPSVGCHGHCRIVAGELDIGQQSVHKTFSDRFFAGLTSTTVPYWSVHDYSDVTYGNQKASAKCPVRSPKPECKRYEFPEARLFVKRLRDARPHSHIRLLFSEQAPAYVIGGRSTNVLNGSRQEQINAAKRFQSIRTLFPEVTNVDFYELFGAQGFDSGVVVPRDPRPRLADSDQFRPAYCQLTGESQSNCTSVP